MKKFYDTCSLLDLQEKAFEEEFYISLVTLQELENIKTSANKDAEIKYKARKLTRLLAENEDLYTVIIDTEELNNNDMKIITDAKSLNEPVEFITKDLSCKNLASAYKLNVNYIKEENLDNYTGFKEIIIEKEEELAYFYEHMNENIYNLYINQYLIIKTQDGGVIGPYIWTGTEHKEIGYPDFYSVHFGKIKPKDEYQFAAMDCLNRNQVSLLRGPAGSGKAQPNSTLIPTKNGYVKLGDIKVGDKVLDRFGNETEVLAVYPQGLKENYKITFSDGRTAYCNNEHIWTCYTSRGNLKNFTVQEMLDSGLQQKCGDWKYKIPTSAPVEYSEKQFSIDPYVIGAFLGDGCCKEKPLTISSNDEEIVSEIAKLIGAVEYHKNSEFNYSWCFYFKEKTGVKGPKTRFQTTEFFKEYLSNLVQPAQEKSIPEEYKFGSIQQRYALIQGLMDTDGTIDNAQKGRTSFTSTSLKLVKDLQEICWSLGMSASISEDDRKEKYHNGVCYRLMISCEKENKPNLFRLKRKKDIAIAYANNKIKSVHSNKLTIKAIEKMPHLEEMTCILVDNDEHLYLTEQYIVTHNTFLSIAYMFHLLEKGKIDKIIIFCNTVATAGAAKLGFYPGTKNDKLLDSQIGNILSSKLGSRLVVEDMIESGKLLLLPFSDIRGFDTTGMQAAIYITEAQNLDITLLQLALQRVGDDCICIIDGDDTAQVDSIDYAGYNNGIRRASEVYRGEDFYGEITLQENYRCRVGKIAEKM